MKYKALIIDDEELAVENLSILLGRYCPQIEVIASANRAEQALNILNNQRPDVVFLDMHIPEMKGFDIIDLASHRDFRIIVVSAHSDYAIEGIKHQVLDYLLKPIDPRELIESVRKLPPLQQRQSEQITVSDMQHVYIMRPAEIIYIKADRTQSDIFRRNDKKISGISKPLSAFETLLPAKKFYRCHNSYLINLDDAKLYIKGENIVVLTNNEQIPVSRERKDGLWEAIQNNITE